MADVNTQESSSRKKSPRKTRKRSTRIDMTAMVDVAFLLLTFFVLTATMNDSFIMEVVKPPKCEDCPPFEVDQGKIVTLILEKGDKVSYYHGIASEELKTTDFSDNGIRKVILDHIHRKENLCDKDNPKKDCWDPIFVIKPKKESRFANLVDILDEMAITGARKYALAEFTPQDSLLLATNVHP